MRKNIELQPHHLLCLFCFIGKGYDDTFAENLAALKNCLEENNPLITLTNTLDQICAPCPHRCGEQCDKQHLIDQLNKRHLDVLEMKAGEFIRWHDVEKKIQNQVAMEKFEFMCEGCEWFDFCRKVVILQDDGY